MRAVSRRVNRRGESTRQALLDAAIELWAATGWRGTGIIAVAERAGVTAATLLHHFGTKEEFLLQVLAEVDNRALAYWDEQGPLTGLEYIRRVLGRARDRDEQPGLWKLHLTLQAENLDTEGPAYEYYALRHRFLHTTFADAVRGGQEAGEIRAEVNPDLVAAQMLAFMSGMWLHIAHGPEEVDAADVFDEFIERLVESIATPGGAG